MRVGQITDAWERMGRRELSKLLFPRRSWARQPPWHEAAVDAGQAGEVLLLGQHLGLKRLYPRGQCRTTVPGLLRADQTERRILREPPGVADILTAAMRL
jgi:hypothetical protein